MNCTVCNAPLEVNARFCPRCGEPVAAAAKNNMIANPVNSPYQSAPIMGEGEPPTLPLSEQKHEPFILRPNYQQPPTQQWSQAAPAYPQQSSNYPQGRPDARANKLSDTGNDRPRRRRRGCLAGSLITLIVVLVLVGGGWFLVIRPYVDNMAQSKLNGILDDAVNHIPPPVTQLPAGPVAVTERVLNNLLVLGSSPNDIVKNAQIHITSSAMNLQFDVYGFTCTVSGVPVVSQGHLMVTNVNVQGIAALILTADEITALANRHLADAQARLNHPILSVNLKDQELDMVLGSPGSVPSGGLPPGVTPPAGVTPPTLP
ncbi:MAG: hypothetical protein NVSMB27_43470 [Ktedonobacteraceae bacterium]